MRSDRAGLVVLAAASVPSSWAWRRSN